LPAWVRGRPLPQQAGLLALGVVLLTLSSRVSVPVGPVPVTMQTLVVILAGAVYGWRLGGLCVAIWLLVGAAGAPVLSDASAGLAKFTGPTAGYLFAFPLAAVLVGWLVERGWDRGRLVRIFALMLLAHAVCLSFGGAWLGYTVGLAAAWGKGVEPFLVGALLKSVLGALLLALPSAYARKG